MKVSCRFYVLSFVLVTITGPAYSLCRDTPTSVQLTNNLNQSWTFTSLQQAVDQAKPGDRIVANNYVRNESITIRDKQNLQIKGMCDTQISALQIEGSSQIKLSDIKIARAGGSEAGILLKSGQSKANFEVEIYRIVIDGKNEPGDGIKVGNKNEAIVIKESVIKNNSGNGINFNGSFQTLHKISSSKISSNGLNGIKLTQKSIVDIRDTRVELNGILGDGENGYGIKITDEFDQPKNITLVNVSLNLNNGYQVAGRFSRDIPPNDYILDSTDNNNITTLSAEGEGVVCPLLTERLPEYNLCWILDPGS